MLWPSAVVANATLDSASNAVRQWIDSIPPRWLVVGVCLLAGLFVFGLVKKFVWLAVTIAILAVIVGGLWMLAGKSVI